MHLMKLAIYAFASSGIGTAAFILFAWAVSGFHLPALGVLLPFSLIGAALGSAIGWYQYISPKTHRGTVPSH